MSKKIDFKIRFDDGCKECIFDVDPDELNEFQKKLYDFCAKTVNVPVKCIVCQFKAALALNGGYSGINQKLLESWGWVTIPLDDS